MCPHGSTCTFSSPISKTYSLKINKMNIYQNHPREEWRHIVQRPVLDTSILKQQVKTVLNGVKKNGDKAIKRYTKQFDGVVLSDFFVTVKEMDEVIDVLPINLKNAIQQAAENIR